MTDKQIDEALEALNTIDIYLPTELLFGRKIQIIRQALERQRRVPEKMDAKDMKRVNATRKEADMARSLEPLPTCPASRHVHQIAEDLIAHGDNYLLQTEPIHCAESMLAVITALWELRAAAPEPDND